MTRTQRRLGLIGLALVLGLGGTVLAVALRGSGEASSAPAPLSAATDPVPVRIQKVLRTAGDGSREKAVSATGTLEPNARVALAFPVEGVIASFGADEGEAVRAGQVLARLDAVPYQAALDQAQARVSYLSSRWERTVGLHERELVADDKLDADRAELEAAEAEAKLAAWRVERTELRAPFAGKVLRRGVEPGQVVSTDTEAFVLLSVDTLELEVGIPARDLSRLAAGSEVSVRVEDLGRSFRGYVDHFPVSGDPRAGSVAVTVKVPNPEGDLLPGLVALCTFASPVRADSGDPEIRIPVSAVRATPEGPVVFVVRDGLAVEAPLRTGEIRGDQVVVRHGLSEGDLLIHEAPDRLRAGDRVVEAG
jgi:membrane fusion protein (multidrug efflux system)